MPIFYPLIKVHAHRKYIRVGRLRGLVASASLDDFCLPLERWFPRTAAGQPTWDGLCTPEHSFRETFSRFPISRACETLGLLPFKSKGRLETPNLSWATEPGAGQALPTAPPAGVSVSHHWAPATIFSPVATFPHHPACSGTGKEVTSCLFFPRSEDGQRWRLCLGEPDWPLENTGTSPDRPRITSLEFCPWIPYRDTGKGQQPCSRRRRKRYSLDVIATFSSVWHDYTRHSREERRGP